MSLNLNRVIAELQGMTVMVLRRRYAEVFGEETRSYHKDYLLRTIAWRVQANAEGDLPERLRRLQERAVEIADDADLRSRAPGPARPPTAAARAARAVDDGEVATLPLTAPADSRLPMPGALLVRTYRNREIRIRVLPRGFEC